MKHGVAQKVEKDGRKEAVAKSGDGGSGGEAECLEGDHFLSLDLFLPHL